MEGLNFLVRVNMKIKFSCIINDLAKNPCGGRYNRVQSEIYFVLFFSILRILKMSIFLYLKFYTSKILFHVI